MIHSCLGKVTGKGTCIGFDCHNAGSFGKNLKVNHGNKLGTFVKVNGQTMIVASISGEFDFTPDGTPYVTVILETPNKVGHRHIGKRHTIPSEQRTAWRNEQLRREKYIASVK